MRNGSFGRPWAIPSVAAGIPIQMARRQALLDGGTSAVGWKVGLGTAALQDRWGIDGPLVGYLTGDGQRRSGSVIEVEGWASPLLEPELFLLVGHDIPAGAGPDAAVAAVEGAGPALELIDVDGRINDLASLVANNIFHRHVVLGPVCAPTLTELSSLHVSVTNHGAVVASTDRPTSLTGDLPEILAYVAEWLAVAGPGLRAGDVVIAGSLVPPIALTRGDEIAADFGALGQLSLGFC